MNDLQFRLRQKIDEVTLDKKFNKFINKQPQLNEVQLEHKNTSQFPTIQHIARNNTQSQKRLNINFIIEQKTQKEEKRKIRSKSHVSLSTDKNTKTVLKASNSVGRNKVASKGNIDNLKNNIIDKHISSKSHITSSIVGKGSLQTPIKLSRPNIGLQSNKPDYNYMIQKLNKNTQKLDSTKILRIRDNQIQNLQYQNIKRTDQITQTQLSYGNIPTIIELLKKFIKKHQINSGMIFYEKILKLRYKPVYCNFQLLTLFHNWQSLNRVHHIPGIQFHHPDIQSGQQLAAQKIQAFFKMIFHKKFFFKLKNFIHQITSIQRYWRLALNVKRHREKIRTIIQSNMERHKETQKILAERWELIKSGIRFQVHLCALTLEDFKRMTTDCQYQKENGGLSRIFRAMDDNLRVIYVTPLKVGEQLIKYYRKIFKLNGLELDGRVYFCHPEHAQYFQKSHNMSTLQALLYSGRTLNRIKKIIGAHNAYIVPGYPSIEYIKLASNLNIPLYQSNQVISRLITHKSGSKRLLEQMKSSQIQTLKFIDEIYTQKQLYNRLSILIYRNKQIKQWYIKIQDEINYRGIGIIQLQRIKLMEQILEGNLNQFQQISLIKQQLQSQLPKILKITHPHLYHNYSQFISHFLTRGGIIEAAITHLKPIPYSISFTIQPHGEFYILNTYHKFQLSPIPSTFTLKAPANQTNINIHSIVRDLYRQLWLRKKMFGYFTIDLLIIPQAIMAIGLDCYLNEKASSIWMCNFMSQGHYDKETNTIQNTLGLPLQYIFCSSVSITIQQQLVAFFKKCKFSNISFDLDNKRGTCFLLVDEIQSQKIGFICIADNLQKVLDETNRTLEFIGKNRNSKKPCDIGRIKGCITAWQRRYTRTQPRQLINLNSLF